MKPLRHGELLALIASLGLLVVLALDWFGDRSGYAALGPVMVVLVVAVALLGVALAVLTVRGRPPAWPVAAGVALSFVGILVWPVLVLRTLVFGPGEEDVALWGWIGLLLAALAPLGGWLAMADERKRAPESAYTPPPARPVPGTPAA